MKAILGIALGSALLLSTACGDDGGTADTGMADTGPGDTSTVDTSVTDTSTGPTTIINALFVDPEGTPLADVKSAVDVGDVRTEGLSGADGILTMAIPAVVGDTITVTNALEGYTIISRLDFELTDMGVGEGAEPVEITLFPLEVPLGSRTMFTITATGVPSGGKLCASHGAGDNQNWSLCSAPDATWRYEVPVRAIGDAVNVWLVDDTDTAIDFERVPIAAGETSVSVDFDGAFDTAPETRTVRLDFPDDPESPIATATALPPEWLGWFSLSDNATGQLWGIATNPQVDGSDITADVTLMTPPAGLEVRYGAAAWTNISIRTGAEAVSFAAFLGDPGTTATMLGFPEITDGSSITDAFTIDAPTAPAGEELEHVLTFRNGSGRSVWQIRSSATTIQAPELPTDYDTDVSFPFPGAPGVAVVTTFYVLEEDAMPGIDADYRSAVSRSVTIDF